MELFGVIVLIGAQVERHVMKFSMKKYRHNILMATVLLSSCIVVTAVNSSAVSAISNGLIDISSSSGQCMSSGSIDAFDAAWSWTKPTLEVSSDNGTTWGVSADYGTTVCRDVTSSGNKYWFIVQPLTGGSDDMGSAALGFVFKVTIPVKTGDNLTRLTGYSDVVSFQESNGAAVIVTKASPVAKVDYGNVNDAAGVAAFIATHAECATYNTVQTISKCPVTRATRDRVATVIQHIEFSTSTLTSWQLLQKGLWIGANVNGYNVNLTCGTLGGDASSSGGGNYQGGNDGGANIPGGSSGSSTPTVASLEVSVTGTPHLRADGSVNSGSLKAFIPKNVALQCLGDGKPETTLAVVATAITVDRTEATEGASKPAFTATAVSTPVEGIVVSVPTMTFSNPTYVVSSTLAAQNLAVLINGQNTSSGAKKNTIMTTVKGTRATVTVTLLVKGTFKVYKTYKKKTTLLKTIKGKKGANKFTTAYAKGMTFSAKDSKGKSIAKAVSTKAIPFLV